MPKSRQFIDRKNCQRFSLIPFLAKSTSDIGEITPSSAQDSNRRKRDQTKFGIFYEDDYNYLQHLKSTNDYSNELIDAFRIEKSEGKKVEIKHEEVLPKVSDEELDPEIVQTFSENFDYDDPDNLIDDDFVFQASEGTTHVNNKYPDSLNSNSDPNLTENEENYVIREHEDGDVCTLNERFEELYQNYNDEEIGSLDDYELEEHGLGNKYILETVVNQSTNTPKNKEPSNVDDTYIEPISKFTDLSRYLYESSTDDPESSGDDGTKDTWDCESILGQPNHVRYSSKLIMDPYKISMTKKGFPFDDDVRDKQRLTARNLKALSDETHISTTQSPAQHLNVILADKLQNKDRKRNVKLERRQRRTEKKLNKTAFRQENIKHHTELINIVHNHPNAIKLP